LNNGWCVKHLNFARYSSREQGVLSRTTLKTRLHDDAIYSSYKSLNAANYAMMVLTDNCTHKSD